MKDPLIISTRSFISYLLKHKHILILVLLFSFLSLSFIVPNGNYSCEDGICGLRIGGWHMHDAMWHLALVRMAFSKIPFIHPEFSGALLTGYNYLLDLIIYLLTRAGLPAMFVFFKFLPTLFIFLYTYLLIYYGKIRNNTPTYIWSLLFFMFFGSSFTYLIPAIYEQSLYYASMKGFPVVTSIQPGLIFLNLQFAYSIITLLGILILIQKPSSLKRNLWIGVLLFITTSLKFYGGAVAFLIIILHEFFSYIDARKPVIFVKNLAPPVLFLVLSIFLFYNPSQALSGTTFSFVPLAIVHLMIEDPLLFYSRNLTLARYYLYEHGVSPRLIAIESYSILLFLLVNFGTRLIAIPTIIKSIIRNKITRMNVIFLITILATAIMPILFVQDGGWYNTMQFLYYGVFLASFFAADTLAGLLSKRKPAYIVIAIIIILLTLPNNFEQLRYLSEEKQLISQDELSALDFLALQPQGPVFVTNPLKKTAYISALSGQQTYFVDVDQLMVTRVNYLDRLPQALHSDKLDPATINAKYWYLVRSDPDFPALQSKIQVLENFQEIYSNDSVILFRKSKQ